MSVMSGVQAGAKSLRSWKWAK